MTTPETNTDIAIIGTGPVGLIAALAIGRTTGYRVTLTGPLPNEEQIERDTRTTAFMVPSLVMLEKLGLWPALEPVSAPLKHLSMIDDCGGLFRAPDCRFSAEELQLPWFAQNIPNKYLLKQLIDAVNDTPSINWLATRAVTELKLQPNGQIIMLENGTSHKAALVIGADGRNSICRKAANIKATPWQYEQSAIACEFSHERPHKASSIELHRKSGPLTLIPLKEHRASLVWSLKPGDAKAVLELGDDAFCEKLYEASQAIWGKISNPGKRVAFPITGLKVDKFAANRIALVGEAAHVVPPIGAQGLNLGLRDVAVLADCLKQQTSLVGDLTAFETAYNQNRQKDVWSRTTAIDWLNKSLLASFLPLSIARSAGLHILKASKTARKTMMQAGLEGGAELPGLMTRP